MVESPGSQGSRYIHVKSKGGLGRGVGSSGGAPGVSDVNDTLGALSAVEPKSVRKELPLTRAVSRAWVAHEARLEP